MTYSRKITKVYGAICEGIDACPIEIEIVYTIGDKKRLEFLGLNSVIGFNFNKKMGSIIPRLGYESPNYNYLYNLLPVDTPKNDSSLDLSMAIAFLIEEGNLNDESLNFINDTIFIGELSLEGYVYPIKNALSIAMSLKSMGKKNVVIPQGNAKECSLIDSSNIYSIKHISDIFTISSLKKLKNEMVHGDVKKFDLDFKDVIGQDHAKRAFEIAAAGRHNILLYGPPGSGKTMLSKRMPFIMPPLSHNEILETTRIFSSAGMLKDGNPVIHLPFRNPHHSISPIGMIGGGLPIYPGEVSFAHNGILFMDEFLEFHKKSIESLRECLEENKVHLKRARESITLPAKFMLIAAFNPCPCGYFGEDMKKCVCPLQRIKKYLDKLSGPLLDRIDIQIHVKPIHSHEIIHTSDDKNDYCSKEMAIRIENAKTVQFERNKSNTYNGNIRPEIVELICNLSPMAKDYIKSIFKSLSISMRSYHKIIKISRTIADLDQKEMIEIKHMKEALSLRSFDELTRKFNVI